MDDQQNKKKKMAICIPTMVNYFKLQFASDEFLYACVCSNAIFKQSH